MKSILHNIVDHVVLLSMEEGKTRHMHSQFDNLGISEELFKGIPGSAVKDKYPEDAIKRFYLNAFGNLESFRRIMKKYYESRAIALFEDELILVHDFNEQLERFMNEVPTDWDMIYFSGNHTAKPERITNHVYRIMGSWGIHGIILHKRTYDEVIQLTDKFPVPFDSVMHDMQYHRKAYCTNPHLTYPYPSFSTVQERFYYYNFKSPEMLR
jgi:hypothetical protein